MSSTVPISPLPRCAALALLLLLAPSACSSAPETYYPLESARIWTYAVTIRQGDGPPASGQSRIVNLPSRQLAGRAATPQQADMFGRRSLRFLVDDGDAVSEIAEQSATDGEPRFATPFNVILRAPLTPGASWTAIWQSNQFGRRTALPMTKTVTRRDATVTVPAGTFESCVELDLAGSGQVATADGTFVIDIAGTEWFAPGIGYVRGTFVETIPGRPENAVRVEVALIETGG